jgi:hypothetical protein
MEEAIAFLGRSWNALCRPSQLQLDNDSKSAGGRREGCYFSGVIPLYVRFGASQC